MYFEFYLDDLEIEEPQGFADIVLNMKRDENWHGVFFEASTSDLGFYGAAAGYLKEKKNAHGLKSEVTFKALQACGIYEDLELIYEGRLDFGKYSESCGNICIVKIPVEQVGCVMTLRNRYDQKVNLDSTVTFNKQSVLQQYDRLNFQIDLPAKELQSAVAGNVSEDGFTHEIGLGTIPGLSGGIFWIRPDYEVEEYNNIATGQLIAVNSCVNNNNISIDGCDGPLTPQLLFEDSIDCFDGTFEYTSRKKGAIDFGDNLIVASVKHILFTWDGVGDIFSTAALVAESTIFTGSDSGPVAYPFDDTLTGSIVLGEGVGLYAVIEAVVIRVGGNSHIITAFDKETLIDISAVRVCPTTSAGVYLINETLSRITEAITDNCLKVKSDYYGRIDSQPYTSTEDGCGALRVVTSGLQIRKAPNPVFFASLKDTFDGLRGIDNIGMGIEVNPNMPGFNWLRIESVNYFYQDVEILSLPFVPAPEISVQEQLHYSLIKTGYQKWEVERVNGLDELNSTREYRTILTSVNNTLDITSKFIAGSYPIEVTRQQSFAETGATDTTYDNETFIICIERSAYSFQVERGNIDNAANVFSPATLYNWRIRPYSNLMRWFKSIANSYPNIIDSENKLYFGSGTGNFLAEGELPAGDTCKLENGVKSENRDLSQLDFADVLDATPLWKPEFASLRYPLSVAEYRTLRANPYGYISFQCGTGEWKKGFIQDLRYRLNKGEADFTLKLKYE